MRCKQRILTRLCGSDVKSWFDGRMYRCVGHGGQGVGNTKLPYCALLVLHFFMRFVCLAMYKVVIATAIFVAVNKCGREAINGSFGKDNKVFCEHLY